jgi:hypothetical protein
MYVYIYIYIYICIYIYIYIAMQEQDEGCRSSTVNDPAAQAQHIYTYTYLCIYSMLGLVLLGVSLARQSMHTYICIHM